MRLPAQVDCLALRSYDGDLLVVEDIVERGTTLRLALELLWAKKPASVTVCTLLRKPAMLTGPIVELRYVGFDIADDFVVGYGLDFDQRYRNLPYVAVL